MKWTSQDHLKLQRKLSLVEVLPLGFLEPSLDGASFPEGAGAALPMGQRGDRFALGFLGCNFDSFSARILLSGGAWNSAGETAAQPEVHGTNGHPAAFRMRRKRRTAVRHCVWGGGFLFDAAGTAGPLGTA